MSSRKPRDNSRFTLSMTDGGPRFVLDTKKSAASARSGGGAETPPEPVAALPASTPIEAPAAPVPIEAPAAPAQVVAMEAPPAPVPAPEAMVEEKTERVAPAAVVEAPVASAPPEVDTKADTKVDTCAPGPVVIEATLVSSEKVAIDDASRRGTGVHGKLSRKAKKQMAARERAAETSASAAAPSAPVVRAAQSGRASKPSVPSVGPSPTPASRPEARPATPAATAPLATGRTSEAIWKASLPPQAVAADYTVESGVERVHAPTATPEVALRLMKEAEDLAKVAPPRTPQKRNGFAHVGPVRVSRAVIAALLVAVLGAALLVRLWPEASSENVLVAGSGRVESSRARLATANGSRLFARGLDGELQKALDSGMYVVVERRKDGTMSNESIVEDMMTRDLESAQKLARIKSETLWQPLFIIARRNGEVAVVERVNPQDRAAWRDYTMNVWNLKQHALSWPRERYLSREALDSRKTLTAMTEFVRTHPNSRVVGPALEDIRYICYYNLQDPSKFRQVALNLLEGALQGQERSSNVPELVYVMKPYLKEAMNQFLYQRVHRLTPERATLRADDSKTSVFNAPVQY